MTAPAHILFLLLLSGFCLLLAGCGPLGDDEEIPEVTFSGEEAEIEQTVQRALGSIEDCESGTENFLAQTSGVDPSEALDFCRRTAATPAEIVVEPGPVSVLAITIDADTATAEAVQQDIFPGVEAELELFLIRDGSTWKVERIVSASTSGEIDLSAITDGEADCSSELEEAGGIEALGPALVAGTLSRGVFAIGIACGASKDLPEDQAAIVRCAGLSAFAELPNSAMNDLAAVSQLLGRVDEFIQPCTQNPASPSLSFSSYTGPTLPPLPAPGSSDGTKGEGTATEGDGSGKDEQPGRKKGNDGSGSGIGVTEGGAGSSGPSGSTPPSEGTPPPAETTPPAAGNGGGQSELDDYLDCIERNPSDAGIESCAEEFAGA